MNSNCTESECNDTNKTLDHRPNVIYSVGVSDDKTDSVHIVFSTVTNVPCVQFLYSKDSNEYLTFDYNKLINHNQSQLNNSINVKTPGKISYSFGVCLLNLIEYNDTEDKADPAKVKPDQFTSTSFSDFVWGLAHEVDDAPDYRRFRISAHSRYLNDTNDTIQPMARDPNGSIDLVYRVSKHEKRERSEELPHLEFTGDSVQLELVLNNLTTRYPRSRFSVELSLVCSSIDLRVGINLEKISSSSFEDVELFLALH